MTSKEFEKMFLDLNSVLVKFWIEQGRPDKEIKIELLERMLNWYKKMGYCTLDAQSASGSSETPNDLKKAADKYIYKAADSPGDDWTTDDIRNAYIAGYKLHEANTPLPEDTVLFNKGVEEGKRLMMEEAVKWLVDDDYHEASEKGRFILGSVGLGYNGYYIPYSDLLKLPKEDELK